MLQVRAWTAKALASALAVVACTPFQSSPAAWHGWRLRLQQLAHLLERRHEQAGADSKVGIQSHTTRFALQHSCRRS